MNILHVHFTTTGITLLYNILEYKSVKTMYGLCWHITIQYSSPSFSGHSQQRPLSLMWPQISAATTMNAFNSPLRQRPPL